MRKYSLVLRITLINFLFLAIPTFLWMIIFFQKKPSEALKEVLYHMQDIAYSNAIRVQGNIDYAEEILSVLIDRFNLSEVAALNKETLSQQLKEAISASPSLSDIIYTKSAEDNRFVIWQAAQPSTKLGMDVTNHLFVSSVTQEKEQSMNLGLDSEGFLRVFVSQAIKNDENITGVLTATYEVAKFLDDLHDSEYGFLDTNFTLMTREGIVFFGDNPSELMHSYFPLSSPQIERLYEQGVINQRAIKYLPMKEFSIAPFKGLFKRSLNEGELLIFTWDIPESNALLAVTTKKNAALKNCYKYLIYSILLISVTTIFASLLIWFLIRQLSQPIAEFISIMDEISKGNLATRYQKTPLGYEINDLGDAVNRMTTNLAIQIETIKSEFLKQKSVEEEMKIGHQIQQRILPQSLPVIEKISMAAIAKPSLEVGGDFYDIFTTRANKLFFAIADGAGKGIPACLYALSLQSMIRSYALLSDDISLILKSVNSVFCRDTEESSMFVTLFMGLFEPETLSFRYFNAGHPPALVKHLDGTVDKLATSGSPVGVGPFSSIEPTSIQLSAGDILLLYIDGITEAMNAVGELYGEERLVSFLKSTTAQTANAVLDALMKEIENFEGTAKQNDDITAIVVCLA